MALWFLSVCLSVCAGVCVSVGGSADVYSQTCTAPIRCVKMLGGNVYAADKSELSCVHRQAQA